MTEITLHIVFLLFKSWQVLLEFSKFDLHLLLIDKFKY